MLEFKEKFYFKNDPEWIKIYNTQIKPYLDPIINDTVDLESKVKLLRKIPPIYKRFAMNKIFENVPRITLKYGRATPVKNQPAVAIAPQNLAKSFSLPTLNNLNKLAELYGIKWEIGYKVPVESRPVFSYFVKGRTKSGEDILYSRKETSHKAAGQTLIFTKHHGSFRVSHCLAGNKPALM